MTRSKRAKRLARREYAEKRAGSLPLRVQQPTSPVSNRKTSKQKPAKPFYARREFTYILYAISAVVVIILLAYGVFGRQKEAGSAVAQSPTVVSSTGVVVKQYSAPPPITIDLIKSYFAIIETEKGTMKAELFAKDAPKTVNNFVFLSRQGFYDGLTFHRVLSDFVAQGGDPKGDGTGGPGYMIEDEFSHRQHLVGTLAMAHSAAPNSGGSQFYITLAPQPSLDGKYSVFGQLMEGTDIPSKLTLRNPDERPSFLGDKITKITIEEK